MTREKAISRLKEGAPFSEIYEPVWEEALDMAIKSLEQEPCEDCVSREAVQDKAYAYGYGLEPEGYCVDVANIQSLPSVTPTRKAHNNNEDYAECDQFVCSNCGVELQDWHRVERDEDDGEISYHEYIFKYCPNCGAKIESEDKE